MNGPLAEKYPHLARGGAREELRRRFTRTLERLTANVPVGAKEREILLFPGTFGIGQWEIPGGKKARPWRAESIRVNGRRYRLDGPETELDLVTVRWKEGRTRHEVQRYVMHPEWLTTPVEEDAYQILRKAGVPKVEAGIAAMHSSEIRPDTLDVYATLIRDGAAPRDAAKLAEALVEETP